ncbi:MAG: PEP-CTERM sorting domain-containing protein [Planctomycetales bacterium]|nr:PEP-CTERM sorting domain-containing protein [Planctomycetales bacterium]
MTVGKYRTSGKHLKTLAFAALLACSIAISTASAELKVDFDGGDNTAWALTNSSGEAPAILSGGPTGSFLRLANLTGSINNSIALDENPTVTGPAPNGKQLTFDFRMSDNEANANAGGCCNSAADGMGIGYFATPLYGASGALNPAAADGASPWERPVFAGAAVVGLDVFEDIDVVSLNAFGGVLAEVDVRPLGLDLNNGVFHRGIFTVLPDPADSTKSLWSVDIIEDVNGANPVLHNVISDLPTTVDLNGLPLNRVIAGARTGGAFLNADLDNVSVRFVPEPSGLMPLLIGMAGVSSLLRRRARRGPVSN